MLTLTLTAGARRHLAATVAVDGAGDLTGAAVELDIDGVRHPMQWTSSDAGPSVSRTARTVGCLVTGEVAEPVAGDIALSSGRFVARAVVTLNDGQIIPGAATLIITRSS